MTIEELKEFSNENLADNSNIVPAEHRAVNDKIIDEIYANRTVIEENSDEIENIYKYLPKNRGYVGNIDIGTLIPSFSFGGNTVGVVSNSSGAGTSIFTVEFANEMPSMNYMVKPFLEVESGTILQGAQMPLISKIDTTHFQIAVSELLGITQDLRLNYEIISLD